MKKYLDKLNEILTQGVTGSLETFEKLPSHFSMNKKASEEQITECANSFENKLPEDYKNFLGIYNGGILFQIEDIGGFKFLGTDELVKENTFQKENFGEDWNENIILFCLCIGDGEYLGFKIDDNKIVHCIMDEIPSNWKIIENSFNELVTKLIDERGRKYWI